MAKLTLNRALVLTLALLAESAHAQPTGPGYALTYGSGGYVSASTGKIPSSGDFTVECWAKVTGGSANAEIISQGTSGNAFYIGYEIASGTFSLGDGWRTTSVAYPFGPPAAWHHMAVVKTATSASFYLDGVLKTNRTSAIPNPALTEMRFGRQYQGGLETGQWEGPIDEVRIWNTARTQAQITNNMHRLLVGNEANLVSYWRFDEDSGYSTFDTGGTAAQVINPPSFPWVASTVPFVPGAVTSNASNVTANSAALNGTVYFNSGGPTTAWFDWGTTTNYTNQTPSIPVGGAGSLLFSRNLSNLAPAQVYHFRLVASNTFGLTFGTNQTFATPSNSELTALTTTAGPLTPAFTNSISSYAVAVGNIVTSITLTCTAADDTVTISNRINGGPFSALASGVASGPLELIPGENPIDVKVTPQNGSSKTYTIIVNRLPLPPLATTQPATAITSTRAVLNGSMNPNGSTTAAWFEWGITTSYGNRTSITTLGSGSTAVAVAANATGLTPATTYHFRIDSTNAGGLATGGDLTFSTATDSSTYPKLASLTTSADPLTPTFHPLVVEYYAFVANGTPRINVTPTAADATSTIQVRINGGSYSALASGSTSGWLSLNSGDNFIDVLVTAQAAASTNVYRLTINQGGSGNQVGYTGLALPPGFSMLARHLTANAAADTVSNLFGSPVPNGCSVFTMSGTGFKATSYLNGWTDPNMLIQPGDGWFFNNPYATNLFNVIAGELVSGTNRLPAGLSACSRLLPTQGRLFSELGFPADEGDTVYVYDTIDQNYVPYTFQSSGWTPEDPFIKVAQSFFAFKSNPTSWAALTGGHSGYGVTQGSLTSTVGQVNFFTFNATNANRGRVFDVDNLTPLSATCSGQLYGNTNASENTFVPMGSPATFKVGSGAGYLSGGTVPVTSAFGGQTVYAQLRVWRKADGGTFEAAVLNGGVVGKSVHMQLTAHSTVEAGQPGVPPPDVNTFPSFNLGTSPGGNTDVAATLSSSAYTTNHQFRFNVSGLVGSNYVIQVTTNLSTTNWLSLLTNVAPFIFVESNTVVFPQRFYRAVSR